MLISEFAAATGLSRDTVRYYARLGLLRPAAGGKGGSRPYQVFGPEDLRAAELVRVGQSLGLSLKAILALDRERRSDGMAPPRAVEILDAQLRELDRKAADLAMLRRYLRAKIDRLNADGSGQSASHDPCACAVPLPARRVARDEA